MSETIKNLEKYKADLKRLVSEGTNLHAKLVLETKRDYAVKYKKSNPDEYKVLLKLIPQFSGQYQHWYSEAYELIRQLLPSRLGDFEEYYKGKGTRKEITYASYTIKDALNGLQVTRGWEKEKVVGADAAISLMEQQVKIVESIQKKFESSLFDIKTLVQADLLDDELAEAGLLLKNGYLRAAGAVAGVALESHLKFVALTHKIMVSKKNPSISDYNDALKDAVLETAEWRRIQLLADLRNKCDHKKTFDPTKEDVDDLINGVSKVIKSVF